MYNIENLSENSLRVLNKALDLYLRIGLGQLEVVGDVLSMDTGNFVAAKENNRNILNQYKKEVTGFSSGASYGIFNENVKQSFREAYEMSNILTKIKTGLKSLSKEPAIILKEVL